MQSKFDKLKILPIIIASCFQKLLYEFLKAYLILCQVNQSFTL